MASIFWHLSEISPRANLFNVQLIAVKLWSAGMTKLEYAFAEAAKLPQGEQDALAELILEELTAEERWANAFQSSQDALAQLADEARSEHRSGKTQPLDPDQL
jgi:hypothetical protein